MFERGSCSLFLVLRKDICSQRGLNMIPLDLRQKGKQRKCRDCWQFICWLWPFLLPLTILVLDCFCTKISKSLSSCKNISTGQMASAIKHRVMSSHWSYQHSLQCFTLHSLSWLLPFIYTMKLYEIWLYEILIREGRDQEAAMAVLALTLPLQIADLKN